MTIEMKETKDVYRTGKIGSNRKEKSFFASMIGVAAVDGELRTIVDARFYGRSTIYCCVWISNSKTNFHVSGGGKAGGYGYHKMSAAFADALANAGIGNTGIDSVGDSAMESAIYAIMKELGYLSMTKVFTIQA